MVSKSMPGGSCLKCKRGDVALVYARKDAYCSECFILFAKSKYRRAIDAFRLELPPRKKDVKMLLALSGSESSLVLLDLAYTAVARTRGRYEMPIVLHIDDAEFTGISQAAIRERLELLRRRYPDLVIIERPLSSIHQYTTAGPENQIDSSQTHKSINLQSCISSLSSRTSQEDMLTMYKERLILVTARENGCAAILFGNSATSLAAKTLSLTAKGRGYALPWETADHSLSHTGIWSIRPMKGLMSSEVRIYAKLVGLTTNDMTKTKISKPSSIDELTHKYFDELEEQFPSLVATVVRTTNKLVEPTAPEQAMGSCTICGMSFQHDARKWLSDITVSAAAPDMGADELVRKSDIPYSAATLCYGCVVALRGSKTDMDWPIFNDDDTPRSRGHDADQLLAEFELSD